MIKAVDGRLHHSLQVFEVEQQAGLVEFAALQGDPHLVIVAVRILALTFVVAQVMSGGEGVFNGDFEHIYFLLAFLESVVGFDSLSDFESDLASDVLSEDLPSELSALTLSDLPPSLPFFPEEAGEGFLA